MHGALLLAALVSVSLAWPSGRWPWYLLLPLLLYGGIASATPLLRRTLPPLTPGRTRGAVLATGGALSVLTAAVLVGFQAVACPELSALAANLPVAAFPNLVLAGVCFSILNAVMEELVYRVVFWDTVAREWNTTVALIVTSLLFGLGHVHGYPPGPLGGVLAGLYGLALGLLRWWAGGLVLVVLCHISADATIFCIMVMSGAFSTAGS